MGDLWRKISFPSIHCPAIVSRRRKRHPELLFRIVLVEFASIACLRALNAVINYCSAEDNSNGDKSRRASFYTIYAQRDGWAASCHILIVVNQPHCFAPVFNTVQLRTGGFRLRRFTRTRFYSGIFYNRSIKFRRLCCYPRSRTIKYWPKFAVLAIDPEGSCRQKNHSMTRSY